MKVKKFYWVAMCEKAMLVLGIESTAHTFGASIVDSDGKILSDIRRIYTPPKGEGIHPREAARHHTEAAPSVLKEALDAAGISIKELDAIAYSAGPGLGPCLRVGACLTRALSSFYSKPIVPVHHAVGHLELGCLLTGAKKPVALLVSGGHTMVVSPAGGCWRIFGETLDLTIGQLIDQFGRSMGLASPAGQAIEELATKGRKYIELPYVVKGNDVSFSGMLTFLKKALEKNMRPEDLAFSLQETAFAMLVEVLERALALNRAKEVLLVGGVAANRRLSRMVEEMAERHGAEVRVIPKKYSGDCGPQIAWPGLLYHHYGIETSPLKAFIKQSWRLDKVEVPWRG